MNLRIALLWLMACTPALPAADSVVLFSRGEMQDMKKADAAAKLRADADMKLKAGPWSVTYHRPKRGPTNPHDYFSEGPYWWPDPKNPTGPYIRRDGERNPDRFVDNHDDLGRMGQAILSLGAAAWLFDDPAYAKRAAEVISVWFIAPATRMNPNLEYGQAIVGVSEGRGTGIIDTVSLIWAVQGMAFLEASGRWNTRDREAARKWFADYLHWLTESAKGLDEKRSGNNHSSWWAAQAASYAAFAGDRGVQEMVWRLYREDLIPKQMREDGSCPREEARTNSLGYSAFNLNALAMVCRLAEKQGVDLWHFRAPSGAGMQTGISYLLPYVVNPGKWQKRQISKFNNDGSYFLGLAGLGLKNDEDLAAWNKLKNPSPAWHVLLDLLSRRTP